MSEHQYTILLVYSSSYAVRAEKILRKEGIDTKMIPIPRHISSNCGVCVRIHTDDVNDALEVLDNSNLPLDGVYNLD
ncbi:DUF3343 domain-containing protein [Mobilitalea sibirica]|uniref:DUF3343 domain-containing protein n=1 Tax=Mobilitalea sibirica TaxID=1462919 RepID=A0A8J7L1Z6_9FIRM|nr:DUF3343 domain-containing protein [Mobilitalea sibirica]MBH1939653.1 DUF3343 domain-containing protein [Mobilitalea sibirica]